MIAVRADTRSALERITTLRHSGDERTVKAATAMKAYAEDLWRFAVGAKKPPVFISIDPDNQRVVITVREGPQELVDKFREAGYRTQAHQFLPGETQVYSRIPALARYEVKVRQQAEAVAASR